MTIAFRFRIVAAQLLTANNAWDEHFLGLFNKFIEDRRRVNFGHRSTFCFTERSNVERRPNLSAQVESALRCGRQRDVEADRARPAPLADEDDAGTSGGVAGWEVGGNTLHQRAPATWRMENKAAAQAMLDAGPRARKVGPGCQGARLCETEGFELL